MSISSIQPAASVLNKTQFTYKAEVTKTSVEVNFSIKDNPQFFTYQMTVDKLTEELSIDLTEYGIKPSNAAETDFSPEAVADRIVTFATGFYSAFAARHDELDQNEQLSDFMSIIRGAVEKGFNEAKDVLTAMSAFEGGVADTANQTFELIQEKFDSFESRMLDSFLDK